MTTPTTPQAPNTGRILDYWLGGDHHFPPDAAAAQAFDKLYPGFPEVFATLRRFIGRAVRAVADEGITQFLVLGSGIPAQQNVHEVVPQARVLYTDIDQVNIELGRQILADLPTVDYAYCDAADLSTLDTEAVSRILDRDAPLGVVMVGVSAFLDDATVARTLADLYRWGSAGNRLVADFDGEALASHPAVLRILDDAGEPLHLRGPAQIEPLLGPWQLSAEGIQPVSVWRDPDAGPPPPGGVFMYGCLASKA
jgi:O-methyltransferase involved in polyketide biosynthesis